MKEELEIYEKISEEIKYGTFKKTIFHVHTPASHDYYLYEKYKEKKDEYKKLNDADMVKIAIAEGLIKNDSLKDVLEPTSEFETKKEYIAYLLIAKKLIDNNIDIALITDHNTVKGYTKLKEAIKIVYNDYKKKNTKCSCTSLILGVEISCSDMNHVVGIFDEHTLIKLDSFLKEYIMTYESGTYLNTYDVINKIKELKGFYYIAHINSSNILKNDFLSGAYKKKIFSDENMKIIGIADGSKIIAEENRLKNYTKRKFEFVIDSDSHSLDSLCEKYFWMKGTKCDFSIIKDLYRDTEIQLSLNKIEEPNTYIKGIAIRNIEENFLISKDFKKNKEKHMILSYSPSLNCIIGGRGTGKSTMLNILQFALSQKAISKSSLEMVCKHKQVWTVVKHDKEDYIIKLLPPVKEYENDDIMRSFEDDDFGYKKYKSKYDFDPQKVKKYARKNCIELYRIIKDNNNNVSIVSDNSNKYKILNEIFKEVYSINHLVSISNNEEKLAYFIYNLIMQNEEINIVNSNFVRVKRKKEIFESINKIDEIIKSQTLLIEEKIKDFNDQNKDTIIIEHKVNVSFDERIIEELLPEDDEGFITIKRNKYNMRWEAIKAYIENIANIEGPIIFLKKMYENKLDDYIHKYDLKDYFEEKSIKKIDEGAGSSNSSDLIKDINNLLISRMNVKVFNEVIFSIFRDCHTFDLKFNVNSNKKNSNKIYRSISELSLGQKVVALLSFILAYSDYSKDYTPLIIDQPEDNLDSQYIYNNLVKDLRLTKEKRQVIIATHNSTIVTNAKADNIIIMDSDNKNGWIDTCGYQTEEKIVKKILMLLEGGKESFNHKIDTYKDFLN